MAPVLISRTQSHSGILYFNSRVTPYSGNHASVIIIRPMRPWTSFEANWLPIMGDNIRILLVDDHEVARASIALLLMQEPDLEIIGEAFDGLMAVRLARELQPDVIVMDAMMPGMNGIEATRLIMLEFPEIKVIGFSIHAEGEIRAAMQKAGAVACISKSQSAAALISKIRCCRPAATEGHPEANNR